MNEEKIPLSPVQALIHKINKSLGHNINATADFVAKALEAEGKNTVENNDDSILLESAEATKNSQQDENLQSEKLEELVWHFHQQKERVIYTKATILIKLWNFIVIVGIPVVGGIIAKVYYQKSKEFFVQYLPEKLSHPLTEDQWMHLRNLAELTGDSALSANMLFNIITGFKFVIANMVIPDEDVRIIYAHIAKTPRFIIEQLGLSCISVYSSIALSNVSLREEKTLDEMVLATFLFSILSGYMGMRFFYDSIKWLGNLIQEELRSRKIIPPASAQEEVNRTILACFKQIGENEKAEFRRNFGIKITRNRCITPADKVDSTFWGQLKPYIYTSPVSAILSWSRIGLIYNAFEGSKFITPSGWNILLGFNAMLSSFPPIAWGAKGFLTVNAELYRFFTGNASGESSLAEEVFPAERFLLLYITQFFAMGSFASNSKLCVEAAEAWRFPAWLTTSSAIIGGLGSNIVNIFGMRMLVDTVIELFVLNYPSLVPEFTGEYSQRITRVLKSIVPEYIANYAQKISKLKEIVALMELVNRDPKAGIEFLICKPEIIPEVKRRMNPDDINLANLKLQQAISNVGFVVEDLVRIQKQAGYDKSLMINIIKLLNFPGKLIKQFENYTETMRLSTKFGLSKQKISQNIADVPQTNYGSSLNSPYRYVSQ